MFGFGTDVYPVRIYSGISLRSLWLFLRLFRGPAGDCMLSIAFLIHENPVKFDILGLGGSVREVLLIVRSMVVWGSRILNIGASMGRSLYHGLCHVVHLAFIFSEGGVLIRN
ncbi:hypothetical protein BGS_0318 [Beggiatoa sp. SS]|nr:hypothetical protein BGS_0318 [Beggiatoa sp. SS]